MGYNFYKNMKDTDVCVEFKMLKFKVPTIFFGTVGFSPHRDGRYIGRRQNHMLAT
jgi:hypothetical protein